MSKDQDLNVGHIVSIEGVLMLVRGKLEADSSTGPTTYLLFEVGGTRLYQLVSGIGAFEIDAAQAKALQQRIAGRAWNQAGELIRRVQASARAFCTHHGHAG